MVNYVDKVMNLMLVLIPDDYKAETLIQVELAERGIVEASVSLNLNIEIVYETYTETVDGIEVQKTRPIGCTKDMSQNEIYLASYFAYRCYLMKLKDALNRDSINFKTLTFEIKSLEKRPEAINDSIYMVNRYLKDEVNRASGGSSLVGRVTKFGGGLNE